MTRVHHWNQNLLLVLIALHVVAVLLYLLVKHENLIVPMISGRKRVTPAAPLRFASPWLAFALFVLATVAVVAAVWFGGD